MFIFFFFFLCGINTTYLCNHRLEKPAVCIIPATVCTDSQSLNSKTGLIKSLSAVFHHAIFRFEHYITRLVFLVQALCATFLAVNQSSDIYRSERKCTSENNPSCCFKSSTFHLGHVLCFEKTYAVEAVLGSCQDQVQMGSR